MSETRTAGSARIASAAFAAAMIGFGIQGLVTRGFAPIWEPVPEGLPGRAALIYVCAFVGLVTGVGLLFRRTAAAASRALLAFLLLWLLALRLPHMVVSFSVGVWYSACQTAVLAAAAWVLYVWIADERDRRRFAFVAGDGGLRVARALYGLALIPFGIAHFLYLEATAPLVPAWLPGHVAWAYFTGAAFVAAGIAILVGVWARLAAALSVVQIVLFILLVWVPLVTAGKASPFQWTEFTVSCALAAAGWVVAESYRGTPWLAVGKR